VLLGGLYAGGALTSGQVYDVPITQAYSELAAMPLPPMLAQVTGGSNAATVDVRRTPDSIGWHFHLRGQEMSVFTAKLSPEGPGRTRVRVSYEPGNALSPELGQLTSTRLMRDLAEITMSEQVDAHLEHRPFDQSEAMHAMAVHLTDNPEIVQEYGQAVGGMFREINRQAADAAGVGAVPGPVPGLNQSAMDAATRPSVALPVN
jgi:hypothetical protein